MCRVSENSLQIRRFLRTLKSGPEGLELEKL
jgi:hypothetical protein